uniref:Condensin complex subunit 2 n=1 Tax=Meloidogyne hapla TaxID=6305 RepID=A0A1I8B368_MELHA
MATEIFDFDGAGERYKFLLQPVKDLASNWDLDIAKTLEDYIRKVVEDDSTAVLVGSDGRRKVFNFAEAALLIHGTTNVYVRKIEYVHQIALNFFDELKEDKPKEKNKKKNAHGDQDGDDQLGDDDQDTSFSYMRSLLERLSNKPAPSLPTVPIAFIPLSDFEKTDVPLYTRTNSKEQIGKKDDFRINSCHMYESIALLDLKHISLIEKFSETPQQTQKQTNNAQHRTNPGGFVQALEPLLERSTEEEYEGEAYEDGGHIDIEIPEANGFDDENAVITGNTELLDPEEQRAARTRLDNYRSNLFQTQNSEVVNYSVELRSSTNNSELRSSVRIEAIYNNELLDPLEINNEKSKPFRKKANCFTDPAKQIAARNRRIERECQQKGVANERSVKGYINTQMFRHRLKKKNVAFGQFNCFLMDQAVFSLNPLIYEEEKRRAEFQKKLTKERQAARREERIIARRASERTVMDPVFDHPDDEELHDNDATLENNVNNDNGQNGDIGDYDECEDILEEIIAEELSAQVIDDGDLPIGDIPDGANLCDVLDVDDLENSLGGIRNMYTGFDHLVSSKSRNRKALADKLAQNMRNAYDDTIVEADFNPDDLPQRPPSQMDYDEIIAFHLRKYWAASEAAVSKFSERMQLWEAKMTLALDEESQHREFDTRQYGDELLDRFDGQIGSEVDFTGMLHSIPHDYDRSRYLLVSLILANMGNLEINVVDDENIQNGHKNGGEHLERETSPLPNVTDHINLKLLKLERHHQIFEEEQRLLAGISD